MLLQSCTVGAGAPLSNRPNDSHTAGLSSWLTCEPCHKFWSPDTRLRAALLPQFAARLCRLCADVRHTEPSARSAARYSCNEVHLNLSGLQKQRSSGAAPLSPGSDQPDSIGRCVALATGCFHRTLAIVSVQKPPVVRCECKGPHQGREAAVTAGGTPHTA